MNQKREFLDYIEDIIESIKKIESFTKGLSYKSFKKDDKTIFAVIRALEIIGEASKKIPKELKTDFKKIPWLEMGSMRDKVIYEYFGIDLEVIWDTVKKDIPAIKPLLKSMFSTLNKSK